MQTSSSISGSREGEPIAAVPGSEEFGQLLEQGEVLGIVKRHVRLHHLEHALFADAGIGIAPREAEDGADAGLGEKFGIEFDLVGGYEAAEVVGNDFRTS